MTTKHQHLCFIAKGTLLISLFLSTFCFATHPKILQIVTEENPPYQYTDANGEIKGCAIDMVKAMAEITEDKIEIKFLPWARAYAIAETKPNTMIFSMARNTFREHLFYWIGKIQKQDNIFWGLKSKYPTGSLSKSQLFDSSIVIANTSTADHVLTQKKQFNLYRVSDISQGVHMLMHGRTDLLVSPESVLKRRFKKTNQNFNKVVAVYQMPELSYNLSFAFSRQSDQGLVFKYTQAYQQLKQQKVIEKLAKKCQLFHQQ